MKRRTNVYFLTLLISFAAVATSKIPKLCEYWIDGNWTKAVRTEVNDTVFSIDVNDLDLTVGLHKISYRMQNSDGQWGSPTTATVMSSYMHGGYVAPAYCEYWIDGDRTNAVRKAVNDTTFSINVDNLDLPVGLHKVTYRMQNPDGQWGAPMTVPVMSSYMTNGGVVPTKCEYWIDGDRSKAKTESVKEMEFDLGIDASAMAPGYHKVTYRMANADDQWGAPISSGIFINEDFDTKPTAYRQFINDVEVGSGKFESDTTDYTLTCPFTGDFVITEVESAKFSEGDNGVISGEFTGPVIYSLQMISDAGEWGAPYTYSVEHTNNSTSIAEEMVYPSETKFKRIDRPGFKAFKFVPTTDTVFFKTNHNCKIDIYNYVERYDYEKESWLTAMNDRPFSSFTVDNYKNDSWYIIRGFAHDQPYYAFIYDIRDNGSGNDEFVFRTMASDMRAPKPTIKYADGKVSIECVDKTAKIFYTIDFDDTPSHEGEEPKGNTKVYTEPFVADRNMTVRAISWVSDLNDSYMAEFSDVTDIKVAKPELYYDSNMAKFKFHTAEGSATFYTTDGKDPITHGTEYDDSQGFTPNADCTMIMAYSTKPYCEDSNVASYPNPWETFKSEKPKFVENKSKLTVTIEYKEGSEAFYRTYLKGETPGDFQKYEDETIPVTGNMMVEAYQQMPERLPSDHAEIYIDWVKAAAPELQVSGSVVTIVSDVPGRMIHYSFDNNASKEAFTILESGNTVDMGDNGVFRAYISAEGYVDSDIVSLSQRCSPPALKSYDGQILKLDTMEGSTTYCSLNGSNPVVYQSDGIDMEGLSSLTCYSIREGWEDSEEFSFESQYYSVSTADGINVTASVAGVLGKALARLENEDGRIDTGYLKFNGPLGKEKDGDDFGYIRESVSADHLDLTGVTNVGDSEWKEAGLFAGCSIRCITMPEDLSETVSDNMFAGSSRLAAIILPKNGKAPENLLSGFENVNVLVYANKLDYISSLPAKFPNKVSGVSADRIILTDGYPFYCPREFTAKNISFTREFNKKSGFADYGNGSAGWETLALPFGATSFRHEKKGDIYPFGDSSHSDAEHRFWLYNNDEGQWNPASTMTANRVYLISFPNNEDAYISHYNLGGKITFSASQAKVSATPAYESFTEDYRRSVLRIAYEEVFNADSDGLLAVNNEELEFKGETYMPGGCFTEYEAGYGIRPFEAYLETDSTEPVIKIFGNSGVDTQDIFFGLKVWAEGNDLCILSGQEQTLRIYDLGGQLVREVRTEAGEITRVSGLTKGIYFVGNQKVMLTM